MDKNTRNILIVVALVLAYVYRDKIKTYFKKIKNKTTKAMQPASQNLTPNQELEKEGYIDSIISSKREYFDRIQNMDNIKMDDIYSVLDNLSTQELKDLYSTNMSEFEKEFGQYLLSTYSIN